MSSNLSQSLVIVLYLSWVHPHTRRTGTRLRVLAPYPFQGDMCVHIPNRGSPLYLRRVSVSGGLEFEPSSNLGRWFRQPAALSGAWGTKSSYQLILWLDALQPMVSWGKHGRCRLGYLDCRGHASFKKKKMCVHIAPCSKSSKIFLPLSFQVDIFFFSFFYG